MTAPADATNPATGAGLSAGLVPDVSGRPTRLREVDLATFFKPRTVAAIGASDSDRKPNSAMWRKIRTWAQANGAVAYPVHPTREQVDGVTCYPSILDIPDDIDLAAVLTTNVMDAMVDVIQKKAKFAVVFGAGFNEVGDEGAARQRRLEAMLADSEVRLLGPNTNLNAFELFADNPGKAIALITQSGHQGRPIYQSQDLGIRLSHWAPVGNEADLEFADFAGWFVDQPDTGAIAAYIEGFKDGRTLILAADRAIQRGVPVTIVKVGRTDEGRSMAQSHTGHLTGSDKVISAVFRQYGITRVDGLDELQDTAAAFARTKPTTGDGVCIYSISGGTGAHMADIAAAAGLRLPSLSDVTQQRLREWIPDYLRVSNPVDSGGGLSAREPSGSGILEAILDDDGIGLLIVPITGAVGSISEPFARHLVAASKRSDKPIFVVWGSPVGDEPAYRDILLDSELPVFRTFGNCVKAAKAYFDHHQFRASYVSPFAQPRTQPMPGANAARELLAAGKPLAEADAKRVLASYGVPVTREQVVTTADDAVAAARDHGLPVVMKIVSPDILHKSDLGLVAVGVDTDADVRATFDRLLADAAAQAPDADVVGVLVAEQVTGGVETIVGISQDPLFGPTVMFGLGGVFVEVLEDVTFRVAPFDRAEAHRMIREVKGFPLLTGVRGSEAVDLEALVDAIMGVEALAMDLADSLGELDINPLVCSAKGVVALDAVMVPRSASRG